MAQKHPNLILFDLDNTLLDGDSDYEWGAFLCDHQIVDVDKYRRQNTIFYQQYISGELNIYNYLRFALKPLSEHPQEQLLRWRKKFIHEIIEPLIPPSSKALIKQHKEAGDVTVIITATNRFITEPIAEIFTVNDLIATELEIINHRFTGNPQGTPCFREGKITCFEKWRQQTQIRFNQLWFYSDSINDLPLLKYVDKPIIKNGGGEIVTYAKQHGWSIMDS